MANTNPGPVILLGAQRSGTTALAHYLADAYASQGGVFTVNGKLFYYLHRWLKPADLQAQHFRADEIIHGLRRIVPQGRGNDAWLEAASEALENAARKVANFGNHESKSENGSWYLDDGDSWVQLARDIVNESYGRWPFWGEKYNELIHCIPLLERVLDAPRYILLFRNPAAVARSHMNWSGHRPWNPTVKDAAVRKWEAWNKEAIRSLASVSPERLFVVEYDDVAGDDRTVYSIENFVGVPGTARKILSSYKPRRREPDEELSSSAYSTYTALKQLAQDVELRRARATVLK